MSYQLFSEVIKNDYPQTDLAKSLIKQENTWALYVGLNIKGVNYLAIPGGEDPRDFHITLAYGYFTPNGDEDSTAVSVDSAIKEIKNKIPETVTFDKIGRFDASESSDNKDVIYARVKAGQLESVHEELIKSLKNSGIVLEENFKYNPHLTLAYVDPRKEVELKPIDSTATIKSYSYGYGKDSTHEYEYNNISLQKSDDFKIIKRDDEKRLIFGWANVAIKTDGEQVVDHQKDLIEPEDLEEAVYDYVLNFRDGGEEHISSLRKKAKMIESCVFTKEKMRAMGIPEGIVPEGWWIGFYVTDDEAWEKVKDGTYQMFSIEGQGIREEVEETEDVGKSDIDKFNPYHDNAGKFTSGNGGNVSFVTVRTKDPNKQYMADMASYRQKKKDLEEKTADWKKKIKLYTNSLTENKPSEEQKKLSRDMLAAQKEMENAEKVLNNHKGAKASNIQTNSGSNKTDPNNPKFINKKAQKDHLEEDHLSQDEAIKITQKLTGADYDTSKKLANAAYDFTGTQYGGIRRAYSNNDKTSDYGQKGQAIDEFVQKSPKWSGGTLYRGIGVEKQVADDILKKAIMGDPITQNGPSSWSSNPKIAESFSKKGYDKVRIVFVTNKGSTKYGTSVKHLSQFPNEKEVLMSGKAKQRVTDVKYDESNKLYRLFVDDI